MCSILYACTYVDTLQTYVHMYIPMYVRTSVCSVDILQKYIPTYIRTLGHSHTYVHTSVCIPCVQILQEVRTPLRISISLWETQYVYVRMYVRLWVVRHAVVASECYARYHIARPPYEAPNEALDGGR
jgi:hypothetical protein